MSKSQITRVELEQALKRVLSGETTRVAPTRKVSVLAVEEEAGLANGFRILLQRYNSENQRFRYTKLSKYKK